MKWWEGIACPRQHDRNGTRWFSGERRLVKSVFTVFYYVGLQYTARRETIYLIAEFYEPDFELFGVENWITEEANSRLLENFSSYGNLMSFLKFSFLIFVSPNANHITLSLRDYKKHGRELWLFHNFLVSLIWNSINFKLCFLNKIVKTIKN